MGVWGGSRICCNREIPKSDSVFDPRQKGLLNQKWLQKNVSHFFGHDFKKTIKNLTEASSWIWTPFPTLQSGSRQGIGLNGESRQDQSASRQGIGRHRQDQSGSRQGIGGSRQDQSGSRHTLAPSSSPAPALCGLQPRRPPGVHGG